MERKQFHKDNAQQELDRPGKLMVSGIPKDEGFMEKDLEKVFSQFGRITEVSIVRDKRTKIPRGFAFLTYENPKDSVDAIKAMEGKDLGGESKLHCEQAKIGLKMSTTMKNQESGGGGGGNGHGLGRVHESNAGRGVFRGRGGMDRGRGGMDRGRGGMDRGRGRMDLGGGMPDNVRGLLDRGRGLLDRGRGLMDRGRGLLDRGGLMHRGARGMPPLERAMFDAGGFDYQEEEFIEEFYDHEPAHMRFPPPGGLATRGIPARGRRGSQNTMSFRGKQGLLPDPVARGGRPGPNQGSLLGPPPGDFYGDDANEADYFGDHGNPYAEVQEEPYPEEEYPSEEYYEQEWSGQPRGRSALVSRGRGVVPRGRPEARAPRQLVDDYDFEADAAATQRSRTQALAPRRGPQTYDEDVYDEEDIRQSAAAQDPYGRGRGRPLTSTPLAPGRLARGNPSGRPGAAPVRRAGPLLEADPYAEDDAGQYERALPSMAVRGGVRVPAEYEDDPYADPYGRRLPAGVSRQPAAGRSRAALLAADSVYPGDRSHPKPLMEDAMSARKAALGAGASRFDDDGDDDDYQGPGAVSAQARAAYSDGRRPVVRSDPYSRKRPLDPYDEPEMGGHGVSAAIQEYERLRAVTSKRDRPGDRGGYDPFRQEALFF